MGGVDGVFGVAGFGLSMGVGFDTTFCREAYLKAATSVHREPEKILLVEPPATDLPGWDSRPVS